MTVKSGGLDKPLYMRRNRTRLKHSCKEDASYKIFPSSDPFGEDFYMKEK